MEGLAKLSGRGHKEVPVKVTAWADEGVVPLVEALSEFPWIITIDSCQDNGRGAHVFFRHYGDNEEGALFAAALGAALAPYSETAEYRLQATWHAGWDEPRFELACPTDGVKRLADAISACRKSASPCGSLHKAPRSSRDCQILPTDLPWRDEIEQSCASA